MILRTLTKYHEMIIKAHEEVTALQSIIFLRSINYFQLYFPVQISKLSSIKIHLLEMHTDILRQV